MSNFKQAIRENRRGKIPVMVGITPEELDTLKTRVELFEMWESDEYVWLVGYSMNFDPLPLGAEPLAYDAIIHTDYVEGKCIITVVDFKKREAV